MALKIIDVAVVHNQVMIPVSMAPVYVHESPTGFIAHVKDQAGEGAQENLYNVFIMSTYLTISVMVDGGQQRQKWYHRFKQASFQARRLADGSYMMVNPSVPKG